MYNSKYNKPFGPGCPGGPDMPVNPGGPGGPNWPGKPACPIGPKTLQIHIYNFPCRLVVHEHYYTLFI